MTRVKTPLKALVIVNRKARSGGTTDALEERFGEYGIEVEIIRLKKSDDASKVIMKAVKQAGKKPSRFDCVIVGGGDGTLNAAAEGMVASGLPLGILPLGTANDLARTLGIPSEVDAAIGVIAAGYKRVIDVASVGFSAELAKNLTAEAKRKWGVTGYAVTALKLLWKSKPFHATLAYNGQEDRVRTLQVAVGNGAYYGGGMKVAADATPDSGKLDVYSLEVAHWLELPAMLPMLRSGTHTAWPTVRGLRVKDFKLTTRKPMDVNADGELVTTTPASFNVREGVMRVFVPAGKGKAD
jgi:YegS/Rv2252/BmrU family lipid kinase